MMVKVLTDACKDYVVKVGQQFRIKIEITFCISNKRNNLQITKFMEPCPTH